ncbi:unnamed protein product [Didymodactylos carnosus]|uniref:Uncharacterized protein n=1 Tax=Didymodactylos carnosus TaxID=1234261 RepID=A0A815IWZ0_9BILA|nr:unnamed protein product [Didymodactylos carnosus]CAF4263780.1 unnamed protein product [Didymodactylos carnosus]
MVVTRYYRTVLLGHAQATVVVGSILDAFRSDGIDIKKLLMLSRDNPNVNKTIEKMIGDEMKKLGAELLQVGVCNLHVVHNAFKAGEEARRLLAELSAADRTTFFNDVRIMYHTIADYLKTHLPLENKFLRDVQVLDPSLRTEPNSADQMVRVGRGIPRLLSGTEIDRIRGEWMMYAAETIDEQWYIKKRYQDSDGNTQIEHQRIDFYWNKVLSLTTNVGLSKYPTMAKIIKNILIVAHGNSDVERGFSVNEHIVTENRTLLTASSINGLRATWDAINFAGSGSSHKVPVNAELLHAVRKSKSIYNQEQLSLKIAANQMNKDNEDHINVDEKARKLVDQEYHWLSKQKNLQEEQNKAQLSISEGRHRLDNALKKSDMIDAQAANALIGAGDEKVKSISGELKQATDELLKIQSKRKNAFSHRQSSENKKKKVSATTSDWF